MSLYPAEIDKNNAVSAENSTKMSLFPAETA